MSIERSLKELAPLPHAVMKVVHETNKSEPSAANVESYISSDQALTSKLLRVVNSAYYGMSGQVTSVGQAIVILGLHQVRNLALSVASVGVFEADSPRRQDALRRFWMHAFGTATAAQFLAKKQRFDQRGIELVFVGGLLHDIGRLFLYCNFTDAFETVIEKAYREDAALEITEQKMLGMTHADVGYQMALAWRLPDSIGRLIGEHEGPFDDKSSPLVIAIHVADCLNKQRYFDPSKPLKCIQDPSAFEWAKLSEQELEELQMHVEAKVSDAMELFGLIAA